MKKQRIAASFMAVIMALSTISSNVFAADSIAAENVSLEESVISSSAFDAQEAVTEDENDADLGSVQFFADGFTSGGMGNVGTKHFTVTEGEDGSVRLANASVNKGKFSDGADNYAYYAKQVSMDNDFVLKATVSINAYNSQDGASNNHQSSFGIVGFDEFYTSDNTYASQLFLGAYSTKKDTPQNIAAMCRHAADSKKTILETLSGEFQWKSTSGSFNMVLKKSGTNYYMECNGNSYTLSDPDLFVKDTAYFGFYIARNADITISDIEFAEDTRQVTSLNVKKLPDKLIYNIGDTPDLTGAVVEAVYSDGTSEEVDIADIVVSDFDSTTSGQKTMYLNKGKGSVAVEYTVVKDGIVELKIVNEPYINEYTADMRFSSEGAQVQAVLNTGEVLDLIDINEYNEEKASDEEKVVPKYAFYLNGKEINNDYIFTTEDASVKEIEIRAISSDSIEANGASVSYPVEISASVLTALRLYIRPAKNSYYTGDAYDPTGMVIRGVYTAADGTTTTAVVPEEDYTLDVPSFDTAGTKVITITSRVNPSVYVTYDVDVHDPAFINYRLMDYPVMTINVGDEFVPGNLKVGAYFSSRTYEEVSENEYTVDLSAFDSSKAGTTTVTVRVNGKYGAQDIPLTLTVKESQTQVWRYTYFGASTSSGPDSATVKIPEGAVQADTDENGTVIRSSEVIAESAGSYYALSDIPDVTVSSINGAGKITADNDGMSYYFTRLAAEKNFTMKATLTVDYYLKDNDDTQRNAQEAFGIMVRDAVPFVSEDEDPAKANKDSIAVASASVAATDKVSGEPALLKTNGTFSSNMAIIGGCADSNYPTTTDDVSYIRKTTSNRINLLARLGVTDHINGGGSVKRGYYKISNSFPKVGNVYDVEVRKVGDAIYARCYDHQTGETMDTYQFFDDGFVNSLDKDNMYVGIFAARYATVTASNIELYETEPETDVQKYIVPDTATAPTITVASSYFTTLQEYPLILKAGNELGGTVTIKCGDKIVKRDALVTKKGTTYNIDIEPDTINKFTVIYTPNAGDNLLSYDDVITTFDVTHKSSYDRNAPYIYAGPDGVSSAAGTREDPLDIQSAIGFAKKGQKVICLDGTYYPSGNINVPASNNGLKSRPIAVLADEGAKVVLDFQGKYEGMVLRADYWTIRGLEFTNTADNMKGFHLAANNCVIENCKFHDNGDTGFQISRIGNDGNTIADWPSNNVILNCEAYNNADPAGINADGFGAKLTVGVGNIFEGCISHHNLDDGWDTFAKQGSGAIGSVTLEGCVSYKNGYKLDEENNKETAYGAGGHNGFKMGGENVAVQHYLKDCIAFENMANGVTSNSNPQMKLRNVISYNNSGSGFGLYTKTGVEKINFDAKGCINYLSDKDTLASVNASTKYNNLSATPLVSESNYFNWGSGTSYNAKYASAEDEAAKKVTYIDPVTKDFFVSLNEKDSLVNGRYPQDENGKFILGDFLKLTTPYSHDDEDLVEVTTHDLSGNGGSEEEEGTTISNNTETTETTTSSSNRISGGGGGGGTSSKNATTVSADETNTETVSEEKTEATTSDVEDITAVDADTDMFDDMGSKPWAKDAVNALAKMGVINGTGYRTFTPDAGCKRADFAIMLVKLLGIDGTANDNFDDVSENKYYYNFVGLAKENGVVNGYGNGKFGPENLCTREELMVMVANAVNVKGFDIDADITVLDKFGDADDISAWAKPYVAFLVTNGVVNGANGKINPKSEITRAEVAVIMYNLIDAFGLGEQAVEPEEVLEETTEETSEDASEDASEETTEEVTEETTQETTETQA